MVSNLILQTTTTSTIIVRTTIFGCVDANDDLQTQQKEFVVDNENKKFQLFVGEDLVSESRFNVESPDKWFKQKYVTLSDLKTFEKFQGKGYAKYLLTQIFNYVKKQLKINVISLIVYKGNYKALGLYYKGGFKKYMEYDDSLSLVKRL